MRQACGLHDRIDPDTVEAVVPEKLCGNSDNSLSVFGRLLPCDARHPSFAHRALTGYMTIAINRQTKWRSSSLHRMARCMANPLPELCNYLPLRQATRHVTALYYCPSP